VVLRRAPQKDFVVRTIAHREANGLPLMSAEIVIASEATRKQFPLAERYPLHFCKTYYPGRLHGDPRLEFSMQSEACDILGQPPPIGCDQSTFRSCLLPGSPYQRLSPFGVEPEERKLSAARELHLAKAAGLWRLCEDAFERLGRLHAAGLCHGDAELHNFVVCPSPLEILLIDFEAAVKRQDLSDEAWQGMVRKDLLPLLREAILLQCSLGQQPGALAEASRARIQELFRDPERFGREIGEQTNPAP
jgi:hypothetical protein